MSFGSVIKNIFETASYLYLEIQHWVYDSVQCLVKLVPYFNRVVCVTSLQTRASKKFQCPILIPCQNRKSWVILVKEPATTKVAGFRNLSNTCFLVLRRVDMWVTLHSIPSSPLLLVIEHIHTYVHTYIHIKCSSKLQVDQLSLQDIIPSRKDSPAASVATLLLGSLSYITFIIGKQERTHLNRNTL